MKPCALLIHVADWRAGFQWYRQAFPMAEVIDLPEHDFSALRVGGITLEIVQADHKVSSGPSGTVLYWQTDNLEEAVVKLTALGAKLYRGPLDIEDNQVICQLMDPFGNLIGLRAPSQSSSQA